MNSDMRNSRLMIGLFVVNVITELVVLYFMFSYEVLEENIKSFAPVGVLGVVQLFIASIFLFRKKKMNPTLWFHVVVYWVLVFMNLGHLFVTKVEYLTLNVIAGFLLSIYHLAINYSSIELFKIRKVALEFD